MEISTFPMKCNKGIILAKKLATIWLQDKGGRGSSFPRSLSLRSISPQGKIPTMAKLMIFMGKN
jgi:hypothetical protein